MHKLAPEHVLQTALETQRREVSNGGRGPLSWQQHAAVLAGRRRTDDCSGGMG